MPKGNFKLDPNEVMAAAEATLFGLDNTGFCTACGEQHDSCEPDAREYTCYGCGEPAVYGAQEILLCGWC